MRVVAGADSSRRLLHVKVSDEKSGKEGAENQNQNKKEPSGPFAFFSPISPSGSLFSEYLFGGIDFPRAIGRPPMRIIPAPYTL